MHWTRRRAIAAWSILVGCLLLSHPLFAQTDRFHHTLLTLQDGLSNNYVNCVFQDRLGFIWIGTQEGLNRFDGYSFQHYLHLSGSDSSVWRNCVTAIVEDEDGNLWIGTSGGLDRRDKRRETLIHFGHDPKTGEGLSAEAIGSLALDSKGNLWIATATGGVNVLDTRRVNQQIARGDAPAHPFRALKHVPGNPQSPGSNDVIHAFVDRQGRLWMCTRIGIDLFDPSQNSWKHFLLGTAKDGGVGYREVQTYPATIITPTIPGDAGGVDKADIYQDDRGNIWIAHRGLHMYDPASKTIHSVLNRFVSTIVPDGAQGLLLVGNDILWRFSMPNKTVEAVDYDRGARKSGGTIYDCIADRAGSLWIGTDRGLLKRSDARADFTVIKASPPILNNDFHVTALSECESGDILVGTGTRGIKRITATDTAIHLSEERASRSAIQRAEKRIFSIRKRAKHGYTVGTGAGLYLLSEDLKHRERIGYSESDTVSGARAVFTTLEDARGDLWFSTGGGIPPFLHRFDARSGTVDNAGYLERRMSALCGEYIWVMLEDRRHRMWFGTTNGVCCFDPADSSIQHFTHSPNDRTSLSSNRVRSIFEDSRGDIYIGTWGGGISVLRGGTQSFARYTREDGLAGNTVSGMVEDFQGNIWIATLSGLSKFHPDQGTFRNYYTPEIQSVGFFNSHAFLRTRSGRILFGGNGLLSFYPDSIRDNSPEPPLVFTGVSINGALQRRDVLPSDTITLHPFDTYISFEFATLDYADNTQLQYAFRIDGIHDDWIPLGRRRNCSFSELSYGTHTLKIKGSNHDGAWIGRVLTVTIIVVPPFYRTTWCIALIAVFVVLSIGAGFRWRVNTIRKRADRERKSLESELMALRLQINPHFFFNSLNAIQSFVMSSDEELANEYISKFARLMRMVLETSRQRSVTIADELDMLGLYLELESIRFNGRFSHRIVTEPTVDTSLRIPSMMIQPYAENAVRHGLQHRESGGVLTVSLTLLGDVLLCVVEDNGIGRVRASEIRQHRPTGHTSLGTSITSDRLEVLNQLRKKQMTVRTVDLRDESGSATGTRVEISIPME
ncbi:MAG: histidine kinase [Ignavibacteria bacterium]|nr:histidine kinase [Ignavibacteria bacterium]